MPTINPDFSKYTNGYSKEYPFKSVVFPANAPLSGMDLNEVQEILNNKIDGIGTILASCKNGFIPIGEEAFEIDYTPEDDGYEIYKCQYNLNGFISYSGDLFRINNAGQCTYGGRPQNGGPYVIARIDGQFADNSTEIIGSGAPKEDTTSYVLENYLADNSLGLCISKRKYVKITISIEDVSAADDGDGFVILGEYGSPTPYFNKITPLDLNNLPFNGTMNYREVEGWFTGSTSAINGGLDLLNHSGLCLDNAASTDTLNFIVFNHGRISGILTDTIWGKSDSHYCQERFYTSFPLKQQWYRSRTAETNYSWGDLNDISLDTALSGIRAGDNEGDENTRSVIACDLTPLTSTYAANGYIDTTGTSNQASLGIVGFDIDTFEYNLTGTPTKNGMVFSNDSVTIQWNYVDRVDSDDTVTRQYSIKISGKNTAGETVTYTASYNDVTEPFSSTPVVNENMFIGYPNVYKNGTYMGSNITLNIGIHEYVTGNEVDSDQCSISGSGNKISGTGQSNHISGDNNIIESDSYNNFIFSNNGTISGNNSYVNAIVGGRANSITSPTDKRLSANIIAGGMFNHITIKDNASDRNISSNIIAAANHNETFASHTGIFCGYGNSCDGDYGVCFGEYHVVKQYQFKIGRFSKTGSYGSSRSTEGDAFIIGNGTGSNNRSNAFRVTYAGDVYGAAAYQSTGADYAEYFEWIDGNPENMDRRGKFVTLDGEKIRFATSSDDFILGVVSAAPCIKGDSQFDDWHKKYLTDIYGCKLTQTVHHEAEYEDQEVIDPETGKKKIEKVMIHDEFDSVEWILNPDYNPDEEYVSRENRKEWAAVGMMGKLVVEDDGTCVINGFCSPSDNGVATKSDDGYRVMSRIDKTHIKILIK